MMLVELIVIRVPYINKQKQKYFMKQAKSSLTPPKQSTAKTELTETVSVTLKSKGGQLTVTSAKSA